MVILKESKRDDLLLPYLEILKSRGINISLGLFKTIMLDKLSNQGGMHNLSLGSNFYLAGATKYYFNGDLTLNKDLSILKGDESATDQWNEEVCKRLDACIKILRDAFIDTVGTTFEQPEDFGTLSIAKLLRKYNKKINAELGIETETKKKAEKQKTDDDPHVGNGYTFKILYNYNDGTCFERLTAPGSWCITYGTNHYNYYMRALGIHYVIFLKDGYQDVERRCGPGFTKRKPHDEYGNSMIALLQSNEDGHPVYITSRWNHGHPSDNTQGTEADHAYTPEEFYNITGTSPADLDRIFNVWKENKGKRQPNNQSVVEAKKERLAALRYLKYAQYRANGGDSLWNYIAPAKFLAGSVKPEDVEEGARQKVYNKSIMVGRIPGDDESLNKFHFIVDRGQISFDSLIPFNECSFDLSETRYNNTRFDEEGENVNPKAGKMHDVVIIKSQNRQGRNEYSLYDTRRRCLISVDGVTKFKEIPEYWDNNYGSQLMPMFYTVAVRVRQKALIRVSNNQPLVLPNGQCWFGAIRAMGHTYDPSNISGEYVGRKDEAIIEIICDPGERFFYSLSKKDFVKVPSVADVFSNGDACGCRIGHNPVLNTNFFDQNFYSIQYTDRDYYDTWGRYATIVVDKNTNQPVEIAGFTCCAGISSLNFGTLLPGGFAEMKITEDILREYARKFGGSINRHVLVTRNEFATVDLAANKFLTVGGDILIHRYVSCNEGKNGPVLEFSIGADHNFSGGAHVFYEPESKSFILNPHPLHWDYFDDEYMFYVFRQVTYNPIEELWLYVSRPSGYVSLPWNANLADYPMQFAKVFLSRCERRVEQETQPARRIFPAFSISESEIKSMVVRALKLINENGKREK